MSPLWGPDGRHVIWAFVPPGGAPNVYRQAADGSGAPERLTVGEGFKYPTSLTPDGRHLLIQQAPARRIRMLDLNPGAGVTASDETLLTRV
jgi:Tol biopolymer transport system component